jgi:hypothetical protein
MEKEWLKQLNLSEEDQQEWQNSSQEDSLPVWALKNKKLHPDKYIDWAIYQYKVPFLKSSFFHDITPNQPFWNRNKNRENWSENFVPLYEWDSVLFAGCIKPPDKIKDSNTVPVLALPNNLEIVWHKIKKLSTPEKKAFYSSDNPTTSGGNNPQKQPGFFLKSTMVLNSIINNTILAQLKTTPENKSYEQILAISERYFSGAIVFSYQNKEFKPVEWTESMAGPATPVKIDKPSIFKMVVKSRSSYHGFIVNNPEHQNFFAPRGFSSLPKHVTLIPIFSSSKDMIGAFMGVSNRVLHQKHLREITEWTKPLAKPLMETEEDHKAAA